MLLTVLSVKLLKFSCQHACVEKRKNWKHLYMFYVAPSLHFDTDLPCDCLTTMRAIILDNTRILLIILLIILYAYVTGTVKRNSQRKTPKTRLTLHS